MANKLQLSFPDEYREDLESLVRQMGYIRGNGVNISGFLEAIARKELPLFAWSSDRQQILLKLVWLLRDLGNYTAVQELAAMLLERPELNAPIRAELERYQSSRLSDCSSKIRFLVDNHLPFQLSYSDAEGVVVIYNVRYAAIVLRERHQYLDAWVESIDNSRDLPELGHNRSFRFDRIASAGVASLEAEWRTAGLDTVEVEFLLFGRLAHAYELRMDDISDSWVSGREYTPTRVIKRRISNTFWFIREILPYGKDCVVVFPDAVRSRVIEQLEGALSNYVGQ